MSVSGPVQCEFGLYHRSAQPALHPALPEPDGGHSAWWQEPSMQEERPEAQSGWLPLPCIPVFKSGTPGWLFSPTLYPPNNPPWERLQTPRPVAARLPERVSERRERGQAVQVRAGWPGEQTRRRARPVDIVEYRGSRGVMSSPREQ